MRVVIDRFLCGTRWRCCHVAIFIPWVATFCMAVFVSIKMLVPWLLCLANWGYICQDNQFMSFIWVLHMSKNF